MNLTQKDKNWLMEIGFKRVNTNYPELVYNLDGGVYLRVKLNGSVWMNNRPLHCPSLSTLLNILNICQCRQGDVQIRRLCDVCLMTKLELEEKRIRKNGKKKSSRKESPPKTNQTPG